MPERPLISVVIPLYNKRATIARTLQSILAQTLGDFEVIVVDDGSSDGSPDYVAETFSDPRLRIHRQANAGPGAARNAGLALAQGELVTFLDADDAWRPQLLERAAGKLAEHPECAAFTSAFFNEPMGVNRWDELVAAGFTEGVWRLTPEISRPELRQCLNAFHPCTTVYRHEVVQTYGGYYSADRCTFGEDVYLWIQIALNHPIYRHLEPLAHYHTEDSQLGIGGRKGAYPLEPVLTKPGPIRAVCPEPLRDVLELWLAQHAARAAFMQLDRDGYRNARWLMDSFPRIRDWPSEYAKLRWRLRVPTLWAMARGLRKLRARA